MTGPVRMTNPVNAAAASATKPARKAARAHELHDLAEAAAALAAHRPTGGPLALHAAAAARPLPRVDELADRMLVGRTRDGHPEVRLQLAAGEWRGAEVRLVAGKHGLEATVVVASEAARRVVEARLTDLARALEAGGLHVARCQVQRRRQTP